MTGTELPRFVPGPDDWDLGDNGRTSGFDASGSRARHSMTDRRNPVLADYALRTFGFSRDVRAGHLPRRRENVHPLSLQLQRTRII